LRWINVGNLVYDGILDPAQLKIKFLKLRNFLIYLVLTSGILGA